MQKKEENKLWQIGFYLFGRLTILLVIPLFLAIFLGKWLDRKYDTEPWLFLATLAIAFIISNILIVREAMRAMEQMDK